MAPPRFQCLNVVKQAVKRSSNVRAAFFTTQTRTADERSTPKSSSTIDDLLSPVSSTANPATNVAKITYSALRSPLPPRTSDPDFLNSNPIADQKTTQRRRSTEQVALLIAEAARKREERKAALNTAGTVKSVGDHFMAQDYSKQISRRWRAGDVYAPHDLSGVEMKKWKQRKQPTHDVFDVLAFNPEQHYRNFSIMSEYMTPMGRIQHSTETGLRPVNQRRIARAIRRAIGIGMMPSVHRHPEILYAQNQRSENYSPVRSGGPM